MKVVDSPNIMISASVLIVGAGPAGLAAAAAAAQHAKSILIIDENCEAGGQIWRRDVKKHHPQAWNIYSGLLNQSHIQFLFGTRIIAVVDKNSLLVETPDGAKRVDWEKLILCSGARELLLPFPGWTLPGVTGAGGLQALIKSGADLKGKRVVIAGTGPLLLSVAASVKQARGEVVVIAECRSFIDLLKFTLALFATHRKKFWQAIGLMWKIKPWHYRHSAKVTEAHGEQELQSVTLSHSGRHTQIACDLIACGYGLRANLELAELLQCQIQNGAVVVDHVQSTSRTDVWAAGEITGIGGVDKSLIEGRIAGYSAVSISIDEADNVQRKQAVAFAALLQLAFPIDASLRALCKPDTLVCRCEDVTAKELENFSDCRTAKLMTRVGMGACQGRICGAACQFLYGWETPDARQPVFPAKAASLALLADTPFDRKSE